MDNVPPGPTEDATRQTPRHLGHTTANIYGDHFHHPPHLPFLYTRQSPEEHIRHNGQHPKDNGHERHHFYDVSQIVSFVNEPHYRHQAPTEQEMLADIERLHDHPTDYDGEDMHVTENQIKNVYHSLIYIFTVAISQMFSVGSLGIAAFSMRQTAADFHAPSSEMVWYLAAYGITSGVFVLIAGRLGDVFGHKYIFIAGWLWTAAFSLGAGFCSTSVVFDVMRGLTGVGTAMITPCAIALLARAFPPGSTWKNMAFALFGFFAPTGFVVGGAIGAGFAQNVTWRWAYWFWAIMCLFFAILSFLVIPHRLGKSLPGVSMMNYDYVGSLLGVAGLLLFAVAWSQGGGLGWDTVYVYVLLIVSVVCTGLFAVWETIIKHPVLPPSLWTRPGFVPMILALFFGWNSFGVLIYFGPEFLLEFRDLTPLHAVAEFTPIIICGLVATLSAGFFVDWMPVQYIFFAACCSFLFGNLMFSLTPAHQMYWKMVFPAFALTGFGPDLSFTAASIVISNTLLPSEQGVGGSLINTVVLYSAGLGMSIAGTVEHYVLLDTNNDLLLAFRACLWLGVGFAGISIFIVVFFVRDVRFQKKENTESDEDETKAVEPSIPAQNIEQH
ncbi:transmembrane transporter [Malassezia pachydermatis]